MNYTKGLAKKYNARRASLRRSLYDAISSSFKAGMGGGVKGSSSHEFALLAPKTPYIIYVHIPFCDSICRDCPYSRGTNKERIEEYCNCLIKEMEFVGRYINDNNDVRPAAVYFGGGTPSLIPVDLMEKIMNTLKKYFIKDLSTQVTLEASPSSLDFNSFKALKDIGINRLSIGVQSFDTGVLKEMGRDYNFEKVNEVIKRVSDFGWNFNVDLMYGFDSQTQEMFLSDVKRCIDMNASHITIYSLYRKLMQQEKQLLERKQYEMYYTAREMMLDSGFTQYRIEDFARNKESINLFQQFDKLPYRDSIPFGTSGYGYTSLAGNVIKYKNLDKYIECINKEIPPLYTIPEEKESSMVSYLILSLCNMNIDLDAFKAKFGVHPLETKIEFIDTLKKMGFLDITKEEMKLYEDILFEFYMLHTDVFFNDMRQPADPEFV